MLEASRVSVGWLDGLTIDVNMYDFAFVSINLKLLWMCKERFLEVTLMS